MKFFYTYLFLPYLLVLLHLFWRCWPIKPALEFEPITYPYCLILHRWTKDAKEVNIQNAQLTGTPICLLNLQGCLMFQEN